MRKIGITDFWTQILFRPLHDAIYAQLSKIPNDGTSDQTGPIIRMIGALNLVVKPKGIEDTPPQVIVVNGISVDITTGEGMDKLPPALADVIRKVVSEQANKLVVENPHTTSSDAYDPPLRKKLAFTGKVQTVQSLDLTAATDRLPVELQAQILTILGYPGKL